MTELEFNNRKEKLEQIAKKMQVSMALYEQCLETAEEILQRLNERRIKEKP